MALRMPSPSLHPNGVFYLCVRVPSDLVAKLRRTRVTLPVGGRSTAVAVGERVFLSLKTKDRAAAKARFVEAYGALTRHWEAVRAGPKPLPHRQLVALAGETYRRIAQLVEDDADYLPAGALAEIGAGNEAVAEFLAGCVDPDERERREAAFFAAIQRPLGPQLLAVEIGRDLETPYASVTHAQALEDLFGAEADKLLAERQLVVDAPTRLLLLREVGRAVVLLNAKVHRNVEGDYAEDANLARFPAFVPQQPAAPSATPNLDRGGKITVAQLFQAWRLNKADKTAQATVRRYTPSINSLAAFLKGRDIRVVTQDDLWAWAEHRRDKNGIAPATVNRNDLVAAASVFQFAATRDFATVHFGKAAVDGRRVRTDNPVHGVKLDLPKKRKLRDGTFRADEIGAILTLARQAKDPRYPRASASRRWAPWICAYSGARIQEVCWLGKHDVWCEGGIWVMRFPMTKDGHARTVPLHDALIEEGLLDFWRQAPDGFLFVGDRAQKPGASRSPPEQRASEIAAWIQEKLKLEDGVSPNHGWRHTFITRAEGAGITKRMANAIAGHNKKRDASDGYYAPPVNEMKRDLDLYPRYVI